MQKTGGNAIQNFNLDEQSGTLKLERQQIFLSVSVHKCSSLRLYIHQPWIPQVLVSEALVSLAVPQRGEVGVGMQPVMPHGLLGI